jgi:hypothetical protein
MTEVGMVYDTVMLAARRIMRKPAFAWYTKEQKENGKITCIVE